MILISQKPDLCHQFVVHTHPAVKLKKRQFNKRRTIQEETERNRLVKDRESLESKLVPQSDWLWLLYKEVNNMLTTPLPYTTNCLYRSTIMKNMVGYTVGSNEITYADSIIFDSNIVDKEELIHILVHEITHAKYFTIRVCESDHGAGFQKIDSEIIKTKRRSRSNIEHLFALSKH